MAGSLLLKGFHHNGKTGCDHRCRLKSAFHEALYDARVYTIMVLTVWYSLGSITSELPPVRERRA